MAENIKCPNCPDQIPGCCCYCGVAIPSENQQLGTDPYDEEIHDDLTEHLICEDCGQTRMYDI